MQTTAHGDAPSSTPATDGPRAADPAPDGSAAAADSGTRSPTDVGLMAAHLRISATRLARLLRRQADTGMSPSQLSALTSIERNGPLTLGALADHERVAPPSVTKVVAKLEERGLVARHADAGDRRVAHVTITAAGTDLLADVRQRKDLWLASRLAELTDDQRARLAGALDVLDELTGRAQP